MTRPSYRRKQHLPHNINEIGPDLFQVVVTRNKKPYTKTFSRRRYGSREKALAEAVAYRDELFEILGANRPKGAPRLSPMPHKRRGQRNGVTSVVSYDKRRDCTYRTFKAYYKDLFGKPRTRSFYVGCVDQISNEQIRHAEQTANAFRDEYEWCWENDRVFVPTRYRDWKQRRLYPFKPPQT